MRDQARVEGMPGEPPEPRDYRSVLVPRIFDVQDLNPGRPANVPTKSKEPVDRVVRNKATPKSRNSTALFHPYRSVSAAFIEFF